MPMVAVQPSTTIEHALAYVSAPLGFSLCQIRPRSKAPILAEWNSPSRAISTPAAAMQAFGDTAFGIGLVHETSGTGALDIDHIECARIAFADFGIDLDALITGYPEIVGRSGHGKAIFRVPEGLSTVKLVWPPRNPGEKPITVFELRAGAVQDVLPPSIHPDTQQPYAWRNAPWSFDDGIPFAPEILITIWRDWRQFKAQFEAACPWATPAPEPAPVVRQVSKAHANTIGKFNAANNIVDLLEASGYQKRGRRWLAPTSSSGIPGVVVFPSGKCFSHHTSDPLSDKHAHDAFDVMCMLKYRGDFNAAIRAARREVGTEREELPAIDISALVKDKKNAPDVAPKTKIPATPTHLNQLPGALGEFVAYVLATSQLPQPELAVAAALCMGGVILGRKVATETGLRTNVYLIGVARTAWGKEHARRIIKDTLSAARLDNLLGGEDLASGAGLLARVASSPSVLFQIDEFGLFLQAIQNPNAGSHKAEIATNLMKLFSSAGSMFRGTEYADQKARPRIDIAYPCASLYGTTTPEMLFPALGSSHITSGALNRMLLVLAPESFPTRQPGSMALPPQSVLDWAQQVQQMSDGMAGLVPESPIVVRRGTGAEYALSAFQSDIDAIVSGSDITGTAALWGRAVEHAAKLALIVQMSADPDSREVGEQPMRWAIDYVRHWVGIMAAEVAQRVADSVFGRVVADVMTMIRNAGAKGMTERDISKYSRSFRGLKPAERDQVFESMIRDEQATWIDFPSLSGRGRGRLAMVAAEFLAAAE